MDSETKESQKLLFTPGPLTTSRTVKEAMLRDLGSRDATFIATVRGIRESLLEIAGVAGKGYEAILMQGSGTFGIEAVIGSVTPPNGAWLIIINGAYGRRMAQIATVLGIAYIPLTFPEHRTPDLGVVARALDEHPDITHVAVVHCETTTGILNPVSDIGRLAWKYKKVYFVDAMSSFGAVPLDMEESAIHYLVSSANKCIEGVPGFSLVVARRDDLLRTKGWARSLSLDLLAQWRGLEEDGQFRFTPPTHALLAFAQALDELHAEGGVHARSLRYRSNHDALVTGMRALGFQEYLDESLQGYVITSFRYPTDPKFDFDVFYTLLNQRGFVIYPGKVSDADCFRIGNIGHITVVDVEALLGAIAAVVHEMGVSL
jgi:2-aminoethylphosphonate-pyruvate transaminase